MTYAELVARRNTLSEDLSEVLAQFMQAEPEAAQVLEREIMRLSDEIEDVERLMKTAPIDCPACKGRGDR